MNRNCPECGAPVPEEAKFCPNCGAALQTSETVICKNCGEENPAGTKFCKNCGSALPKKSQKRTKPAEKPVQKSSQFYKPYAYILLFAVLAMIVTLIYNYNLLNTPRKSAANTMNSSTEQSTTNTDASNAPPAQQVSKAELETQLRSVKSQLENNPDNVELNIEMGNLLFDLQRFSEAIPYYEKSLKLHPNNPDVMVDLGVSYFYLENYQKAQDLFEKALKVQPNHVNALYNLGIIGLRTQKMNLVMDAWGKLMQVAPNSSQAAQASHILDQLHKNIQEQQQTNQEGGN